MGICYLGKLPAGLEVVATAQFPPGVVMASSHPLAKKTEVSFDDCRGHAFLRISHTSPIHSIVLPEFALFWDALEPTILCNSTTMVNRLLIAGRGISFFSKIGCMAELARGEMVWRPFSNPQINAIQVGIVIPSHRSLSHVTRQFLERITRRLKQLELTASLID